MIPSDFPAGRPCGRRRRCRPRSGSPTLPETPFQRAVLTTPADRTGARVDRFPARAAFPVSPAGRHPHLHFRGLLKVHSNYGPMDRSTAPRRPLSRGFAAPSHPGPTLASYQIDRQFSGWILLPLVFRASVAHGEGRGEGATAAPNRHGLTRPRHPLVSAFSVSIAMPGGC